MIFVFALAHDCIVFQVVAIYGTEVYLLVLNVLFTQQKDFNTNVAHVEHTLVQSDNLSIDCKH